MLRETDSRNIFGTLQTQQRELLVLAELSGLQADPAIYRIIIELLNQQIDPDAIYKLLKYIRRSSKTGKQTSASTVKKDT